MASSRSPRLVPDTIEFSGQKPYNRPWTRGKVEWASRTARWGQAEVVVWDYRHGRAVRASSCTLTQSPTMPPEDYAWDVFEELEGLLALELVPGYQVSRLDLSRDVVVADDVGIITAAARALVWTGEPCCTYLQWPRALGVLGFPAGLDRLRVYHKGAETAKGAGLVTIPEALKHVIRVEAQLRKAQLPEAVRRHPEGSQDARGGASLIRRLQSERWRPDPTEIEPQPRLEAAMPRWVTKVVDAWLQVHGLAALVPSLSGNPAAPWMAGWR